MEGLRVKYVDSLHVIDHAVVLVLIWLNIQLLCYVVNVLTTVIDQLNHYHIAVYIMQVYKSHCITAQNSCYKQLHLWVYVTRPTLDYCRRNVLLGTCVNSLPRVIMWMAVFCQSHCYTV